MKRKLRLPFKIMCYVSITICLFMLIGIVDSLVYETMTVKESIMWMLICIPAIVVNVKVLLLDESVR